MEVFDDARRADWRRPRNELRQALVGLHERLPKCAAVLIAHTSAQALGAASSAAKVSTRPTSGSSRRSRAMNPHRLSRSSGGGRILQAIR